MRLLLICQYYPPEVGAAANRVAAFARLWQQAGHDVEVMTGLPNHPDGRIKPGYRPGRRIENGLPVIRAWLLPAPAGSFVKRTVGQVTFMVTALAAALRRGRRPDAVVVSTPGFFSIFTGFALRLVWRRPLVLDVRDLWPGFARSYGVVGATWPLVPFEWLERWAYRHADLVFTVSDGLVDQIVDAGADPASVRLIPNGADVDLFEDADTSVIDLRDHIGVPDKPLVGYLGNHGRVHGLETLVEAAGHARDAGLHFVMVGDGPAKEAAIEHARSLGIDNISWLDPVGRDQVPAVLTQVDLCVSTVADIPALGAAIPAKVFDYFLARRPVVASAVGEQRHRIEAMGGVVCHPGDADGLAAAIREVIERPDIDVERNRELMLQRYSRAGLAEAAANEIARVAARS
ncbi:MAG: glycosyltransferase family 4 protein [Acidimicrobiales bacterium]